MGLSPNAFPNGVRCWQSVGNPSRPSAEPPPVPHSPALHASLAAALRCRLLAASWAAAAGEAVLAWDLVERAVEGAPG